MNKSDQISVEATNTEGDTVADFEAPLDSAENPSGTIPQITAPELRDLR